MSQLFSEKSNISHMRIMSMMSFLVGSYIAIYGLYTDKDLSELSVLSSVFVAAAFTGKVVQKFAEKKTEEQPSPKPDNPDA